MPFLKELKHKAKLARTCPKCNTGASKYKKKFGGGLPYPQGAGSISHLPRLGTACQDGGSAPIFGPCHNNKCPGYFIPQRKLCEYCTFSNSFMVSLKSWPQPKYMQQGTFSPQKIMFYVYCQTLFLLEICSLLECSQQIPEKQFGGHCARLREKENLFPSQALLRGKSLTFCTCMCPCARTYDTKIVRNRDVQCNSSKGISLRLNSFKYCTFL